MLSRGELKRRAKRALSLNYWRMVLASLILALISGGIGGSVTYKIKNKNNDFNLNDVFNEELSYEDKLRSIQEQEDAINEKYLNSLNKAVDDIDGTIAVTVVVIALIVALLIIVIASSINIFLTNPLYVGGMGFFLSNADGDGDLGQFALAFRKNYLQIVLGMVLKGLYTFLWTLLFIIPGIIKAYEYRMVPYILADNPSIKQRDAFYLSKEMMSGNKWNAFVLDLSFIGWEILNAMTLGILGIFFVEPYRQQTNANLYLTLRGEKAAIEEVPVYDNYVEMN